MYWAGTCIVAMARGNSLIDFGTQIHSAVRSAHWTDLAANPIQECYTDVLCTRCYGLVMSTIMTVFSHLLLHIFGYPVFTVWIKT